jgi:antitoxin PrlF
MIGHSRPPTSKNKLSECRINIRRSCLVATKLTDEANLTTAMVSSEGRVTIPAPIRAALHLRSGDQVEFVAMEEGEFAMFAVRKSAGKTKKTLKNSGATRPR